MGGGMDCIEYRLVEACWRLAILVLGRPLDFFSEEFVTGNPEERMLLERQFLQHHASCEHCRLLLEGKEPIPGLETVCRIAL